LNREELNIFALLGKTYYTTISSVIVLEPLPK
jgi:hypothetical protein